MVTPPRLYTIYLMKYDETGTADMETGIADMSPGKAAEWKI